MSAPPPYAAPVGAQFGQVAPGQPDQAQPGQFGQPIQTQPGQTQPNQTQPGQAFNGIQPVVKTDDGGDVTAWMPKPVAQNSFVKPGLEYLDVLNEIIIKEASRLRTYTIPKYLILDPHTEWRVGNVIEDFGGPPVFNRPFEANVIDSEGSTMFTLKRPFQCPNPIPCMPCVSTGGTETTLMGNSIAVYARDEIKIGSVTLNSDFKCPWGRLNFTVRDEDGNPMYQLGNNKWDAVCGIGGGDNWFRGDQVFYLKDMQGNRLETITKFAHGFGQDALAGSIYVRKTFKIPFLPSMTANHKATMIAAVLLFYLNLWEHDYENRH